MIGQLKLFGPSVDLTRYPIRVRAAYARLRAEVYRQRVELGRFKYGRLAGARGWSEPRFWRELDVSKRSIEPMVRHGLLRWVGDDLILSHYDSVADARADAFSKKQRENAKKRWGSDRSSDRSSDRILLPKPAPTLKIGDTKPMPARARAGSGTLISDLRSESVGERSLSTTTTIGSERSAGGGGGANAWQGEPEPDPDFDRWRELYTTRPDGDLRIWPDREWSDAAQIWRELGMQRGGVKACLAFTARLLRAPELLEQNGRFRVKPTIFLRKQWTPEFWKRKKTQEKEKNGYGVPETSETLVSAYLGGEA